MENTGNNTIITFTNPETAYLYGLGQSIKEINTWYKQLPSSGVSMHKEYVAQLEGQINNIHKKAMEVLNNKKE